MASLFKEPSGFFTILIGDRITPALVVYPYKKGEARELRRCEYVGVRSEDLPQIRINKLDTSRMVILQPATFRHKKDFNAHRLLRAIDLNILFFTPKGR